MDYRHMVFIRYDTHIKYLCEIILCQKTDLAKKMLPLHSRVMAFFDIMKEKHHQCTMNNLYHSDNF